jgi:hypothetical protein
MNRRLGLALKAACVAIPVLGWWSTQGVEPDTVSFFDRWSQPLFALNLFLTYLGLWGLRLLGSAHQRRVIFELIALSFSIGFFVVMAELPALLVGIDYADVLGTGGAERFTHLHASDNPSNLKDEEVGFRHQPDSGFEGEVAGDLVKLLGIATDRKYAVDVAYDADGFRNPEPMEQAEIVLIGDSFVEAALIPLELALSSRLASATEQRVLNLGVSGYGPEQERRVLERYGLPKKPRWVLWFFFEGNDLIDTGRFDFRQAQRKADAVPKRGFRERSFVVNVLWWFAARSQPPLRADTEYARERHCRYADAVDPSQRDVYFAFNGQQGEHIEQFEKVKSEIRAARDRSEAAGANFVLFYAPVKLRILRELCEFEPGTVVEGWQPDAFPDTMAAFVEEAGIDYVDLTPALVRSAQAGRSPYFPDDGHWNPIAHAVVAHVALEHMREHGEAPPKKATSRHH